jgi:hypothetical protein
MWNKTEPPKDGTRILRWHKIYKCTVSVYYNENNAVQDDGSSNGCVWTTSTLNCTWPEGAFLEYWKEENQSPDIIKWS